MGNGRLALTILAALAIAACKGPEARKQPLGAAPLTGDPAGGAANPRLSLSPEAKAALDSGNALFRAKQYPLALEQYRLAAKLAPDHAAPDFGIYMVADKQHNKKLADSAKAAVASLSGDAGAMFNDTLMQKAHADTKATPARSNP